LILYYTLVLVTLYFYLYGGFMPNRTLCAVLDEMRECYKTRNFSYLGGLIEEAQTLANRMEAALWDQKDFERTQKKHRKLKKEIKEMQDEAEERKGEGSEISTVGSGYFGEGI